MAAQIWKPNVSYGKTPETYTPQKLDSKQQNVRVSLQHRPFVSRNFTKVIQHYLARTTENTQIQSGTTSVWKHSYGQIRQKRFKLFAVRCT